MEASFRPDASIEEIAVAFTLDAIAVASRDFAVELDRSQESIQRVDEILGRIHDSVEAQQIDEEAIGNFAKTFGSYVGEVYRKHRGGAWGMLTMGENTFPAMESTSGTQFWPWGRAYKRIVKGKDENIWNYYQSIDE